MAASQQQLSRRERQIMDIIYKHGRATAAEVREEMPEAPGYSAVRAMLRILEEKGHLCHERDGMRYIYKPTIPRDKAQQTAVKHLLRTFFDGSMEKAMAALLDTTDGPLSEKEYHRLSRLIEEARKEGK